MRVVGSMGGGATPPQHGAHLFHLIPEPPPAYTSCPSPQAAKGEAAAVATLAAPADEADTDSSTIYVKNLAWATEDGALRKHFESAAKAAGGCGCGGVNVLVGG